jgi:hypothetical protein
VSDVGALAAEVHRVPALQEIEAQWRDGDQLGAEVGECRPERRQSIRLRCNDEIKIPAEFRAAVQHACLPADQQAGDRVSLERRERARDR